MFTVISLLIGYIISKILFSIVTIIESSKGDIAIIQGLLEVVINLIISSTIIIIRSINKHPFDRKN